MAKAKKKRVSRRSRAASGFRRYTKGRGKFGGFLKKGIVGDTTSALGAGFLAQMIGDRVAPQATPFITVGAEYAAGGVTGMIIAEGIKSFTGQPSILNQITGLFGGLGQSEGGGGGL